MRGSLLSVCFLACASTTTGSPISNGIPPKAGINEAEEATVWWKEPDVTRDDLVMNSRWIVVVEVHKDERADFNVGQLRYTRQAHVNTVTVVKGDVPARFSVVYAPDVRPPITTQLEPGIRALMFLEPNKNSAILRYPSNGVFRVDSADMVHWFASPHDEKSDMPQRPLRQVAEEIRAVIADPPHRCSLEPVIGNLIDDTMLKCGSAMSKQDRPTVDRCVGDALKRGAPFSAQYRIRGVDSTNRIALIGRENNLVDIFIHDDAPCGIPMGEAWSDRCNPFVAHIVCHEPSLALPDDRYWTRRGPLSCSPESLFRVVCPSWHK